MLLAILISILCLMLILEEYKNQINPIPLMSDDDKSFSDIPNYKTRNLFK